MQQGRKTSIQIKKGLQNRSLLEDTYMRISWFKYLFCRLFSCAFFRFASVLEGTGKGVDDEKSEQKQWNY